jgi:hypothetical protein
MSGIINRLLEKSETLEEMTELLLTEEEKDFFREIGILGHAS